jgi:phage terminase small subunit
MAPRKKAAPKTRKRERPAKPAAAPVAAAPVQDEDAALNAPPDDGLSDKQRAFVEYYVRCWNASKAARQAGYSQANSNVVGPRLLAHVGISAAIKRRAGEIEMGTDEVLARLADHARGSMGEFLTIDKDGLPRMDLQSAHNNDRLHLVRKAKVTTRYVGEEKDKEVSVELELYDAQDALVKIGTRHKLFVNSHEHSGPGGGAIPVTVQDMEDTRKKRWAQVAGGLGRIMETGKPPETGDE